MIPAPHQAFIDQALPKLQVDSRVLGVAAGGSWITRELDEHSDLDLVIVVADADYEAVLGDMRQIANDIGPLLAGFTGDHVGEPRRLLICLYGPPLLHVDLKFVSLADFAHRIENPEVLWEREQALSRCLAETEPEELTVDPQWIEDRFWVWVHYAATKIDRGELFETLDFFSFVRGRALTPLVSLAEGVQPRGVRRLESRFSGYLEAFQGTLADYSRASCLVALRECVSLYQSLRPSGVERREAAEGEAIAFVEALVQRHGAAV